jgi:hypothetical protein
MMRLIFQGGGAIIESEIQSVFGFQKILLSSRSQMPVFDT